MLDTQLKNIHLMYGPKGNSWLCFPESHDVSQEEDKTNWFPEGPCALSAERATTVELYPGRDTFVFDQGNVTENQPITVIALLSESLGMY